MKKVMIYRHSNGFIALISSVLLLGCSIAAAEPSELKFEFDSKKYKSRGGKSSSRWPTYCTVLMKVRNKSKRRPLYAYGRNLAGVMNVRLDDLEGLADHYKISTSGKPQVLVDRYSVTRAKDAPSIAATDWVEADPHPGIVLSIDKIEDWKPRGKGLKELMSLKGAWTEDRRKSIRPEFDAKISGTIRNGKKTAPFTAPAAIIFGQGSGYFIMTIDVEVTLKGELLGLSGSEKKDELTLSLTTTAYSEPPKSLTSPKSGEVRDMPALNMDLDL